MNTWKRAVTYLVKNKVRCVLLLLVLAVISTIMMFSLCLKNGVQESVENLQETYGSNFVVKEDVKNEGERPRFDEKTIQNICDNIQKTEKIQDTCIEVRRLSFYYDKLEFLQGLSAEVMKIDEDPEMLEEDYYYTKVMMPYGYNKSELSHYFQTNTLELIEGRHICETDRNVVIISDKVAEKNHLKIGDHITGEVSELIANGGDMNIILGKVELEIIGIFHANITQVTNEYTIEWEIIENLQFVDAVTMVEMTRVCDEYNDEVWPPLPATLYFYVDNPDELEAIIKRVKEREDIDWEGLMVEVNDSTYQSALSPLQTINGLAVFLFVFILIVCVVLLTLILRMWMKTRKKEMGILLSIGVGQKKIICQFLLEGFIILFIAVLLSVGVTATVSDKVGNRILEQMNGAEKSRREQQEEIKERIEKGEVASEEEYMTLVDQLTVVTEVEAPEELACNLTYSNVVTTVVILMIVLIIVTIVSSREILKMRPKDILSSV